MGRRTPSVAANRNYVVESVAAAKALTNLWLGTCHLSELVTLGLPEIDDRYHVWRVPLRNSAHRKRVGEVVIDAYTGLVVDDKSTRPEMIATRASVKGTEITSISGNGRRPTVSTLENTIALGDCGQLLQEMPEQSVDLIFTSPPYFNARPEYSEFSEYREYLLKMRQVIREAHRTLNEGRFFVMNSAPVLIRRPSRNESSHRIAVPFDLHGIFIEEGYDFVDDIIWLKPEGAGWATGRGRRFAADRNPMQYKAVPVTEYVMVYRKRTPRLIDWHIRHHPEPELVAASKIADGYERTNVWRIHPRTNSKHPAAFPVELARKVIEYYSFQNDVVLDPFAGSGTVGEAAAALKRRFVLFDISPDYVEMMRRSVPKWLGSAAGQTKWLNVAPPEPDQQSFL